MDNNEVMVIGAGLAGCEAAWQLAEDGISVVLYEMKPQKKSPAHHTDSFAELVCSNSFRGDLYHTAPGLLKGELEIGNSLVIDCAKKTKVPAGGAMAVDRVEFSQMVTEKVKSHPNIRVISEEVTEIPRDKLVIVATGPLTSDGLAEDIGKLLQECLPEGEENKSLYFFDAAAPIVSFESVDMESAYFASRYDKGTPDYINCPMEKEEYLAFWEALCSAEEAEIHGFEKKLVFEGCMPVEVAGKRGEDTLLFGCLKPVGLKNPKTGRDPYAVVQLRKENQDGTMYNLVGFQTHLKFPEQKRVFSMIPGLTNAEFLRYGVMHRNTFIDSPRLLDSSFRLREKTNLMFAGQITGVEGYIESVASGWLVARELAFRLKKGEESTLGLTKDTAIGALAQYISDESVVNFQPMKINFGIITPWGSRVKGGKQVKNEMIGKRGIESFTDTMNKAYETEEYSHNMVGYLTSCANPRQEGTT